MARTNFVKAARKPQGNCVGCGKPIAAGQPYKWVHPRYRARVAAHPNCTIPLSATSTSKMVPVWEAVAAVNRDEPDGTVLRDLAETARDVAGEYRESYENIPESLQDSHSELEEKADSLESWADDLETAADEIDEQQGELDTLEEEENTLTQEQNEDNCSAERKTEIETRLKEIAEEKELAEANRDSQMDEIDNCPE